MMNMKTLFSDMSLCTYKVNPRNRCSEMMILKQIRLNFIPIYDSEHNFFGLLYLLNMLKQITLNSLQVIQLTRSLISIWPYKYTSFAVRAPDKKYF